MDLGAVTGQSRGDAGVRAGAELVALCEAAASDDPVALADARQAVRSALGDEALVDACAVIGNFERMTRIADGTGIPLDTPVMMLSEDFRETLGIDQYGAAENSAPLPPLVRLMAPIVRRASRFVMPLMGRAVERDAAKRSPR